MKILMIIILIASLLSIQGAATCFAEDHAADQNTSAKEFVISNLKIGMNLDQIKALNFDLKPDSKNSDSEGNVTAFDIEKIPNIDLVIIYFFNGNVCEIRAFYFSETVEKIGGWQTIYERLLAKLGPSDGDADDAKEKHDATWQFFSVDRYFNLNSTDSGSARLDIADKDALRKITHLKASKAKLGF